MSTPTPVPTFDLFDAIEHAAAPVAERIPYVKAIIYGESGVGKTDLLASIEEAQTLMEEEHWKHLWPAVLLDVEGGQLTLKTRKRGIRVLRVLGWDIPDPDGSFFQQYKGFGLRQVFEYLKSGRHPFKSIGVDHLSEIQKMCSSAIMRQVIKEDPTRDPDVLAVREWGKLSTQMTQLVRAFRDLPYNVFFAAWEKDKKQEDGVVKVGPNISGSFAEDLPGYFDEVWNMQATVDKEGITTRWLVTAPSQRLVAKSRSQLPRAIKDPNLAKVMAQILGFPLKEAVVTTA